MEYSAINITEKFLTFDELWSPKIIAEMNNNQFKLVKVKGEFVQQFPLLLSKYRMIKQPSKKFYSEHMSSSTLIA